MHKFNAFTQQIKRPVRDSSIAINIIQIFLEEKSMVFNQICCHKLLWMSYSDVLHLHVKY